MSQDDNRTQGATVPVVATTNTDLARPLHPWLNYVRYASFAAAPLYLALRAYQQRWTSDDGFINYRVVEQILAGNGPVFNAGQRVEAITSVAWVWLLALVHWLVGGLSLPIEGALLSGASMVVGVSLTMWAAHVYWSYRVPGRRTWPLGAVALVLYPALWDFSTSGLEDGLSVLWIGLSLLAVAKAYAGSLGRRKSGSLQWRWFILIGFGPLVRPDFTLVSAALLAAVYVIEHERLRSFVGHVILAFALSAGYEVFRMAYYASLVPNTAIAKEWAMSYYSAGVPYVLTGLSSQYIMVPIVLGIGLVVAWATTTHTIVRDLAFPVAAWAAGAADLLYEVKVGGDFMLDRMVLIGIVLLLAPVAVAPLPVARLMRRPMGVLLSALAIAWAGVAGIALDSTSHIMVGGFYKGTGQVANERAFWSGFVGVADPLTARDWASAGRSTGYCEGNFLRTEAQHHLGGAYDFTGQSGTCASIHSVQVFTELPAWRHQVVALAGSVGIIGYEAGPGVTVVDYLGLASPYVAHVSLALPRRGRVGHEKHYPIWAIAPYISAFPGAKANGAANVDLRLIRRALTCGQVATMTHDITAPWSWSVAFHNIWDAASLTYLRYPANPVQAVRTLCRPAIHG